MPAAVLKSKGRWRKPLRGERAVPPQGANPKTLRDGLGEVGREVDTANASEVGWRAEARVCLEMIEVVAQVAEFRPLVSVREVQAVRLVRR